MKHICISIVLLLSALLISSKSYGQDAVSASKEFYFGLTPPGMVAVPLTLGAMSTEGWELGGLHGSGMDEYYFVSSLAGPFRPVVIGFRKEGRTWKKYDFYSSGSDVMYSKDKYIERTDTGWSEMKSLGTSFEDIKIMRLTASLQGTLVFDEVGTNGNGILRYSRLVDGKREAPKPFSKEINTANGTPTPSSLQMSPTLFGTVREKADMERRICISVFERKMAPGARLLTLGIK